MPLKMNSQKLAPESQLRLHLKEPDFSQPLLKLDSAQKTQILEKLTTLYGDNGSLKCFGELERIMQVYYAHKTPQMITDDEQFDSSERFTEKDIILITYGDVIRRQGATPLRALVDCLKRFAQFSISTIHVLPFFPYSSDRGFSIIDYEEVDSNIGTWDEIEELSLNFRLMFDGVFNHVSSKSRWFQEFLNGNPRYQDFFIQFSTEKAIPDDYLSLILRPRTSDLLTGFDTIRGRQYVWTTFSKDQIDLNFQNEEVLLRILEVLLYYVRRGADEEAG